MIKRAKTPFTLAMDGNELPFETPRAFALFLEGRTSIPNGRWLEWLGRTKSELEREAVQSKAFLAEFQDALARQIEDTIHCGDGLPDISVKLYTRDHRWREIFEAMHRAGAGGLEFKKIAIAHYLGYVRNRLTALHRLIEARPVSPAVESGKDATAKKPASPPTLIQMLKREAA